MVALPNIYLSDIQTIIDWNNAYLEGTIPASLTEKYLNVLARMEKDMHSLSKGLIKMPTFEN